MKKLIIAAVLAAVTCSTVAAPRQGKVETNAMVCGDHFVLLSATDRTLDGATVNDARMVYAGMEHGAVKGQPTLTFVLVAKVYNGATGRGYVIKMARDARMYPAAFEQDPTNVATNLKYTTSGKGEVCREG